MEHVVVEKILYEDMLYTVAEVATLLKTNPNFVYNLIKSGRLSALKLGSIKIRKISLEKFLQENDGQDLSDLSNVKKLAF